MPPDGEENGADAFLVTKVVTRDKLQTTVRLVEMAIEVGFNHLYQGFVMGQQSDIQNLAVIYGSFQKLATATDTDRLQD